MNIIAETENNDVQVKAKGETEKDVLQLMERENVDDTRSEVSGSVVDENTPENTNNSIWCELCLLVAHHWRICWQFWMHSLNWLLTFPYWRRHWPFHSVMIFYFIFFLLLFLCYIAVIEIDVVCLPPSHLSAFESSSRMWRRIRRGRNASVFRGIKPEKCRMAVLLLVPFIWFSGDCCALDIEKQKQFKGV